MSSSKHALIIVAALSCNALKADWWNNFMDAINSISTQQYPSSAYSTSGHAVEHHSSSMSENEARSYIDQLIKSLDHALRPNMKINKVNLFCKRIGRETLESRSVYSWTPYGKRYKKDMIDQFVGSAILELIEEMAYSYAYKKSKDGSIARRISESMRNNALARIMRNGTLDFEQLTEFVGRALKRAVRDAVNKIDAPYNIAYTPSYSTSYSSAQSAPYEPVYYIPPVQQPSYNPHHASAEPFYDFDVYPSEDCCCCLDSFDSVTRIFIKPCGHDICKSCAQQWFFSGSNKECPQCRTVADRDYMSIMVGA